MEDPPCRGRLDMEREGRRVGVYGGLPEGSPVEAVPPVPPPEKVKPRK